MPEEINKTKEVAAKPEEKVVEKPTENPKKKSKKKLFIFLGIIVLVFFAVGAWFYHYVVTFHGCEINGKYGDCATLEKEAQDAQKTGKVEIATSLSRIRTCIKAFVSDNAKYTINNCKYAKNGKAENLTKTGIGTFTVDYSTLSNAGTEQASFITGYTISPDKTKIFYANATDQNSALNFASGTVEDQNVNTYLLDLITGETINLQKNVTISFYSDKIAARNKVKLQDFFSSTPKVVLTGQESAWSSDSKGVFVDDNNGSILYCSNTCSKVTTHTERSGEGGSPPPYFLNNKIYFQSERTDKGFENRYLVLESYDWKPQ
ncbi:MAG: hypothetical protein ACM3IJ_05180 [Candidatus Levyibacteriota bacterium]